MSDLWLVTRKDIAVPMDPSYVEPWQVMFNRQPRTFVYRQRASAYTRASTLAKKGALKSIIRFTEVETIMTFDGDWTEHDCPVHHMPHGNCLKKDSALDTDALDEMTGGNPYGH